MLAYFAEKYIDPDWSVILTTLLSVFGMYFLCFDFSAKKRSVLKEILRFAWQWAAWALLSALFYWAFPESNSGFAFVPLAYAVIYVVADRRLSLWERIVRTSVFVTIVIYSSAITLPIAMAEGTGAEGRVPVFSLLFKAVLYAGTIFFLQWFSLGRFRFSVYFFALVEGVCVIGYALNLVSIVLGIDDAFRSPFSANFFNSIGLTVTELLVYLMFYKLSDESDKKKKLLLEEQRMKNELKMMSMYEIGYNQVRAVRHEIYNQYSYVNIMLKNGQYEEAEKYFDRLRVFVGSMGKTVYTENRIVNIALNLAVEQAEERGIAADVKAAVPAELGISDTALASVMNNLTSNAIEACERMDGGEKYLRITVSCDRGYLLIREENPVPAGTKEGKNIPLPTSKANKARHGCGLSIINKIAERNGGCFDYEVKEGRFTAKVSMKCDNDKEKEEDEGAGDSRMR